MESNVMTITPQMAEEMLTHNIVNRPLALRRVHTYATDMKNGAWELNGESIRFNDKGELIDGQHRLSAIVEANIPIRIYVTKGVDSSVTLFDRGKARNEADSLIIGGMPKELANNSNIAICKLNYAIQLSNFNSVPFSFVKDFLTEYEEPLLQIHSIAFGFCGKRSGNINVRTSPLLLACFYAISLYPEYEDRIKRFIEVVQSGFYETRDHESAAIVLRNDILQGNFSSDRRDKRIASEFMAEKALYDFLHKIDRKVTYKNSGARIYSNHQKFKVDKNMYK